MASVRGVGDFIGDRFEVFDIHEGGMSLVYVVHDHLGASGRTVVALKTLKDELLGHRVRRSPVRHRVPALGAARPASQHRPGPLRRDHRGQAVRGPRAGAGGRPDPLDRHAPARPGPGAPVRRPVLPGDGARGAAGAELPPRHQAGQPADHRGRHPQDHRLRPGADLRGDGRRPPRTARRLDPAGRVTAKPQRIIFTDPRDQEVRPIGLLISEPRINPPPAGRGARGWGRPPAVEPPAPAREAGASPRLNPRRPRSRR